MGITFDAVTGFLTGEGISFDVVGDGQLTLGISGRNGAWLCSGYVSHDDAQFVFRSHLPVEAPAERRGAVADLLTRLNYQLAFGSFALDFQDGEIVFRTSALVASGPLPDGVVAPVVGVNIVMTDHHLPAITAVAMGDLEPEEGFLLANATEFDGNGGDGSPPVLPEHGHPHTND